MPDAPDDAVTHLAEVLDAADLDHAVDVERLADFTTDELEYLARADELDDPETDGLEGRCV